MKLKSLAAALFAVSLTPAALAADYPNKPIRIVVNMQAGGPLDVLTRGLGEKVSSYLGQPVVIENRSGSGGNIGASAVANAATDGYTYLVSLDTTYTVNPHLYASMGFSMDKLEPAAVLVKHAILLATNAKTELGTLEALIKQSDSAPVNFSTAGNGSPAHFAIALLQQHAKVNYTNVPYRGAAPAILAVVSGEVSAAMLAVPGLLPHVKSGALNALALTGDTRSALLPDVPTMSELGYPQVDFEGKYVLFAPGGTDADRVNTVVKAFQRALNEPDIQERMKALDLQNAFTTGAAAKTLLDKESQRNRELIQAANMTID